MSSPRPPQPVTLIVSLIAGETDLFGPVAAELVSDYGPVSFQSAALLFGFTDYYAPEFGVDLQRCLLAFERLIDPGDLPGIKRAAIQCEGRFLREDGRRRVNIDPGYIALQHLVLATCKPFAHRPYLGRGVYADLTLRYRHGTFEALEWTFPDYGSPEMIAMLNDIRAAYHRRLQGMAAGNPKGGS